MPEPAEELSVSQLVLQAKQLEIDAVRQLADRAELVDAIGHLIHGLQRERGATSIFLASGGQRFADVREQAMAEADEADRQLRRLLALQLQPAQGPTAPMLSLIAWVLLGLQSLPALRAQVQRQQMEAADSVAAYSRLIAGPVELIFHIADAARLPGASRLLVALLHLVQANEAAGQERALGAVLFASGRCAEALQQRVMHLIDAQDRSLQVFADFADEALRADWEAQQLTPDAARLERLRRMLSTARPEAPLDSRHSQAWFDACSARIDSLWQRVLAVIGQLRAECEAQRLRAEQALQDSEGLLQGLRSHPPQHADAVARFFDSRHRPEAAPGLPDATLTPAGESHALMELLQAQAARLAAMEAELDTARRTLHERKVIERAKGVLMSRMGMTEEAAFRALQKTSMDQNRRLLDVAEATLSLPDFAFAPARAT
ncbi:nitrate- and nitrite sensing domain-containing protein [Aquincola sp. J276]|uniref:nitrate- and nitrite sensing domain-containing protein n=1 Tax=Aquincola sp. J276 TaxID=2898432 RepID=UPI002151DBCA|nr:nitrate- and nitrite sensing domain-containing protein [Aquincola sp. J276]MCR5867766.1 nitrate- and nitrite sensing domain-containing protein [Aquincola sp. J276]